MSRSKFDRREFLKDAAKLSLVGASANIFNTSQAIASPLAFWKPASNTAILMGSAGQFYKSANGIDWTSCAVPSLSSGSVIGTFKDKMIAMSSTQAKLYYSSDAGSTWQSITTTNNGWCSIARSKTAVGILSSNNNVVAFWDGSTFMERSLATVQTWKAIASNGSLFVAVGATTANYSTDGSSWSTSSLGAGYTYDSVCWTGQRFIAATTGGAKSKVSADGSSWTNSTNFPPISISAMASSGKILVAFNTSGYSTRSTDHGDSWTSATAISPFETVSNPILAWNGVYFLATCSSSQKIYFSTDGLAWTAKSTFPTGYPWVSLSSF